MSPDHLDRGWLHRLRLRSLPPGTVEAVCAGIIALLPISTYQRYSDDRVGFTLELILCACAALVGRWPIPATLAAALVMAALLAVQLDVKRPGLVVVLVIIASLSARGLGWMRTAMAVWFLLVELVIENTPPQPAGVAVLSAVSYVVLVLIAVFMGEGTRRVAAVRAQGEVDRVAAVQAQRRSIARDLHDTIAYSTTSIILRAEQAKLRGVPDADLQADLDYIIGAGRKSMRDLRGMMETLRRNEPDGAEHPRSPWQVSSLDEVLATRTAELRSHGFVVTSHVDADPSALPESVREALGKVLVEATSNMVKHGDPAGPVSIMIEGGPDAVEAVFINKPKPTPTSRRATARLGLVGARERVEALGGEVQVASEKPDFVMRVLIPLGG